MGRKSSGAQPRQAAWAVVDHDAVIADYRASRLPCQDWMLKQPRLPHTLFKFAPSRRLPGLHAWDSGLTPHFLRSRLSEDLKPKETEQHPRCDHPNEPAQ